MKAIYTLFFCLLFSFASQAQGSFAWGLKGGLAAGFQQWNSFKQDPLLSYQGDLYIENYDGPSANALYAQIGYHVRGSAIRNRGGVNVNSGLPIRITRKFEFRNASLATGFKKRFDLNEKKAYYYVGLRADYTLSTNLKPYDRNSIDGAFFPFAEGMRKFNYGLSGGAGLEFMFSKLVGGIVELNFAPDVSFQYRQPEIPNSLSNNPFTGQSVTIPERQIRNFTLELTVGFRFLRIVEYID